MIMNFFWYARDARTYAANHAINEPDLLIAMESVLMTALRGKLNILHLTPKLFILILILQRLKRCGRYSYRGRCPYEGDAETLKAVTGKWCGKVLNGKPNIPCATKDGQ